jgi:catechol-2,3-dioxygenase
MKITEIEIYTDELKETERFYSEFLGFQEISSTDNTIEFKTGWSKLIFKKSISQNPEYHFAFNIPSNKFEEALEWISSKTELIKVTGNSVIADFKNWNAKSVYFYDNNGNILEFIARFDLKNNSDKIFDASSIECISEIGLVTDHVIHYSDKLIEEYNLQHFSRGGETDVFVPLGDDNGLLIVAGLSKHWYPTEKFVKKSTVKVIFTVRNKTHELILNGD